MRTLAMEWASFRERVVPPTAGEIQVRQTHEAFYAGAASFANLVMNQISGSTEVTPEDDAILDKLLLELAMFYESIRSRKETTRQ